MSKSKKEKRKKLEQNTVSPDKTVSNSEQYMQTITIREKRIGIVFKVIYVIAIFFVAILLDLANKSQEGISTIYILDCGACSFLFSLLGYIVSYIVNEMKCLKLTASDLPKEVMDTTEKSYSKIFDHLYFGGGIAVSLTFLAVMLQEYMCQDIIKPIIIVSFILWWAILWIGRYFKGKVRLVLDFINTFTVITLLISIFLFSAV